LKRPKPQKDQLLNESSQIAPLPVFHVSAESTSRSAGKSVAQQVNLVKGRAFLPELPTGAAADRRKFSSEHACLSALQLGRPSFQSSSAQTMTQLIFVFAVHLRSAT
jgi:hypothetical protein